MHRTIAICAVTLFSLQAGEVLWRDPGAVERLDFAAGPGGRAHIPAPPFTFLKEDSSGSYPKVQVRDARGRHWVVKFGRETRAETFASRIAWASGYYVEPVHFVARGVIRGAHDLTRAAKSISTNGEFEDARFQLRDPNVKFVEGNNWSWTNNPFFGTRELNGLKVLLMLTSNWDNKDARDVDAGVNTGIFQQSGNARLIYAFTDWGGTMGHWGNLARRSVWKCEDFAEDTPQFIRSVEQGRVKWGYHGQHSGEFSDDIRLSDIRWVLRYVGRISDAQMRQGLRVSGATREEAECFTRELRRRIGMLQQVATYGTLQVHSDAAAMGTANRSQTTIR